MKMHLKGEHKMQLHLTMFLQRGHGAVTMQMVHADSVECDDEIDRLKHEIQILLILRSGELQLQGRQK